MLDAAGLEGLFGPFVERTGGAAAADAEQHRAEHHQRAARVQHAKGEKQGDQAGERQTRHNDGSGAVAGGSARGTVGARLDGRAGCEGTV